MNPKIIEIATTLRDHFLGSFAQDSNISIFLCGGSSKSEAPFRRKLGSVISETKSKYRYSVYYPEDMFVELILGHQRQDLLTLENLLAKSASAVVILLQSPGTLAELGAFSNHPQLKDKLLVVIDSRYEKSHSFINTGPVRHLQKQTKSLVIYHDMANPNIALLKGFIRKALRKIASSSSPDINITNPIASYEFYLALVMTFDPVPRVAVLNLAERLYPDDAVLAKTAAETVLNALVNEGNAVLVSGTLRISEQGIERLFAEARTMKRESSRRHFMFRHRTEALNVMLRKRNVMRKERSRLWGVAV